MKARSLIPLVIGLAVGFFAIKMGVDMVKRAKGSESDQGSVLVSARQIDTAAQIEESMLDSRDVPAELVPSDAFSDVKSLLGRVTAMAIPPGIPITKPMLAPPGAQPGLRAKIPAGHRAVSVSVNEESAVAGFIMPGSHVDVSAACTRGGGSKLILSDVEVGAVGQSLSQVGPDGKTVRITKSVTLFLKPEQVQILHAHSGKGRIRLALRGHAKDVQSDSFWSHLLRKAMERPPAPPRPVVKPKEMAAPKAYVVEVVRGSEVERLVFVKASGSSRYERVYDQGFLDEHPGAQERDDPDDPAITEIGE